MRLMPGGIADERAHQRDHPPEEDGPRAPSFEPAVGPVEVVGADADVAAVSVEERPPAPRADGVADQRADNAADRGEGDRQRDVPGQPGQRLEDRWVRRRLAHLPAGHRQDHLGRDRRHDRLERDRHGDANVANRVVHLEDERDDLAVDEVEQRSALGGRAAWHRHASTARTSDARRPRRARGPAPARRRRGRGSRRGSRAARRRPSSRRARRSGSARRGRCAWR